MAQNQMAQWEHLGLCADLHDGAIRARGRDMVGRLGREGWEMIDASTTTRTEPGDGGVQMPVQVIPRIYMMFKRQIAEGQPQVPTHEELESAAVGHYL